MVNSFKSYWMILFLFVAQDWATLGDLALSLLCPFVGIPSLLVLIERN